MTSLAHLEVRQFETYCCIEKLIRPLLPTLISLGKLRVFAWMRHEAYVAQPFGAELRVIDKALCLDKRIGQ